MGGKWAEAYLKRIFFGGMRTTQRCESLISYLRRFIEQKLKLYDFIRRIHRAVCCANFNVLASARIYCSIDQW